MRQTLLLIERPTTAVYVERSDTLKITISGVLRVEISTEIAGRGEQAESRIFLICCNFVIYAENVLIFLKS